MSDPIADRLFAAVETATADLRDYVTAGADALVPLKVAADAWRITDGAALMRVRRDPTLGVKRFGRWFVRRSALAC